jgi:hypothetical protein
LGVAIPSARLAKLLAVVVAGLAAASCDVARDPSGVEGPNARIQPRCQLGCQGDTDDPNPSEAGVYIEGVTPEYCSEGTDLDQRRD